MDVVLIIWAGIPLNRAPSSRNSPFRFTLQDTMAQAIPPATIVEWTVAVVLVKASVLPD